MIFRLQNGSDSIFDQCLSKTYQNYNGIIYHSHSMITLKVNRKENELISIFHIFQNV